MIARLALLAIAAAGPALAGRTATYAGEHPVTKVIILLKGLQVTVEDEGKTEALTYAKFETWCRGSLTVLSQAVQGEKDQISILSSKIESGQRDVSSLTGDITALTVELMARESATRQLDGDRGAAANLYTTTVSDLESTIAAVAAALDALEDAKNNTSLLGFGANMVGPVAALSQPTVYKALTSAAGSRRDELVAFLQEVYKPVRATGVARPDILARGDMEEHVQQYAFKSSTVIELLKELQSSFEQQLLEANAAETNAVNTYNLATEALRKLVQDASASQEEKRSAVSDTQRKLVSWQSDLSGQQADLQADSASLADTQKSCQVKAHEWEMRSKARAGELEAVEAAVAILAKVTGVRIQAPTNPVLPPSPLQPAGVQGPLRTASGIVALLQVVDPRMKAVNMLRKTATTTHSKALARLAQELAAHLGSPFPNELENMIQKMVFRLMNEQKEEDDHKDWCDKELATNNASEARKEDRMAELDAKLELARAREQTLAMEIADADEMVQDIAASITKSADIRAKGKVENHAAMKDAEDAQTAIADATAVLAAFYKQTGMVAKAAYELVQRGSGKVVDLPDAPSTWDSGYTGVADPTQQPAGIIAVLQKTASQFAEMEADTRAQEQTDQELYEQELSELTIEKARRGKESEMKVAERGALAGTIAALTANRKHVKDELALVIQYLKDLTPACIQGDSTYEERKAARATEIEALHQAQDILGNAFKDPAAAQAASPAPALAATQRGANVVPAVTGVARFLAVHPHSGAAA